MASAFTSWAVNGSSNRQAERTARAEAAARAQQQVNNSDEPYTPVGTDPRTSQYHENYDPSNPEHRYTMNPYTGLPL